MDAKTGASAANTNSFEPVSDFVQEGDCDTLLIYLPGFTKEQLRVQLTKSGLLKISGTRPTGDNKWSSFVKDFPVSSNCDTTKISAKFVDGILYLRQPKLNIIPQEDKQAPPEQQKADHQEQAPAEETTPKEAEPTKAEPEKTSYPEGSEKEDKRTSNGRNRENESGRNGSNLVKGKDKVDDKRSGYRLRMERQKVTTVVAVLLAFGFAMYITNMLSVFFRKTWG